MRDAFIARLELLATADKRVILVTGDLGFGVFDRFIRAYPQQYLNAGVAEQNMTGVAAGMAMEGKIVFTYSIANFPTLRCLEQIRNDAAYHDANVKVVAIGGGFSYGALGMSHHATEDLSILRAIGIPVVAPGCLWEAEEAVSALCYTEGTCYLRLDKTAANSTARPGEKFVLGRARRVRDGNDLTLISTGGILKILLDAAERLAERGVSCRILSMHTVNPLDREAVVAAARETGGIITVEEHTVLGGLGGAVAEACLDAGVTPAVFRRIALERGAPYLVGSQEYLRGRYGMDAEAIIETVRNALGVSEAAARIGTGAQ